MNENIFTVLRESLKPEGTFQAVKLNLNDGGRNYFGITFVEDLINELEKKSKVVWTGMAGFSKADVLAMHVLLDSAGIDTKKGNDESTNSKQG